MSRARARDEGLSRVASITRWVAAAGVAATAFLAAVVYKDAPGRAATSSTPSPATGNGSDPSATDPSATDPGLGGGFQAP
ncbi:MAG TPA: hypothetical protein VMU14_23975, partial [Acidimicrobiales bacterium]|nr:hypothetical protein [Acidimicrobiales bacterium]